MQCSYLNVLHLIRLRVYYINPLSFFGLRALSFSTDNKSESGNTLTVASRSKDGLQITHSDHKAAHPDLTAGHLQPH